MSPPTYQTTQTSNSLCPARSHKTAAPLPAPASRLMDVLGLGTGKGESVSDSVQTKKRREGKPSIHLPLPEHCLSPCFFSIW